uniref:Uncharacterized protein n=1 Tax=Ignisphaera aggregans TaxID=334771 RepID=A0A7J2U4Z8_9CREN
MSSIQTPKPKYIITHFDGHGVATATSRARSLGIDASKVYSKYPVTGPEQLPNYIDTYFPMLVQHDVEIIDIPVNLRDPRNYINAINRLASNTSVSIFDHHKTDYQFATQVMARMVIFGSGVEMAEALSNDANRMLAYVGVVADRDSTILSRISREEVERELLPLANRLDVLVRQDAETTLRNLVNSPNPIDYLRGVAVEYPPESLTRYVAVVRRGLNTVLIDLTQLPTQQISGWSWKVMEQIAMIYHNADYVVAISQALDRQTNTMVPVVQVIKYWLSQRPSPRPQLVPVLGRTTVGHDDAFSIRAMDINDARQLAERIFNELELLTPRTVHLVNESRVAEAIRADFNTIIQRLTQILELQTRMYQEYLELKRRQVQLLEQAAQQQPQQQQQRVRYD